MRILAIIMAIALAANAAAQSKKDIINIEPFDRIVLASGINLILNKAEKRKITVEAERTIVPKVVCEVQNGELSIYAHKFKWRTSKKINIYVDYDSTIVSISAPSGNKIRCETPLVGEYLELNGKNGCDFFVNVDVTKVKAKAETGTNIQLVGTAREADLYADNGCSLKAYGLKCSRMWVSAMWSSSAEVFASESLHVSSSGNCTILYKGDPAHTQINTLSGSRALPQ